MKRLFLALWIVGLLAAPLTASAKVSLFACEPEWAALAKEIGGDKITVFSATHAKQDPHHIRARPSLIAKARHADVMVCSGGGLEEGWLPLLLQKASGKVQQGEAGYLMAAEHVPMLEKPKVLDRSMGHIHPEGNPHVHLNPHNIMKIAIELTQRLVVIDAENSDYYQHRLEEFLSRWRAAIARWENEALPLKDSSIVVHHGAFTYLLDWLHINMAASLEPKPGIPPTSSHLEQLLLQLKTEPVNLIIRAPYEPDEAAQWLAKKTNTPAIILPYTINGDPQSADLFSLFDRSIDLLKASIHD